MNLLARWNLWRAKQKLNPRAAFRRTLKNRLLTVWETRYGGVASPWFIRRYAGAFATGMIVVLTGTTGAYAYTSPEVTEGTILYPVKRAIEQVEEKIKTTPEAKAAFYLKQITRREAEKNILKRRQKRVEKVEAEIEKNEGSLAAVEQKIATSTSPEIKARAHERLEKRKERLERRPDTLEGKEETVKREEENEAEREPEQGKQRPEKIEGREKRKNKTDH
ncbi:MAG: hypothetical protein HY983_02040 [Candidatus Magasanikbacteria bacterium]|nr:hypothetical protein [Candidatus Magasanikbacteria bacterium]